MTPPVVVIQFEQPRRAFLPGQPLSGRFHVEGVDGDEVTACEVSVLWRTEGKGNEDFAVHHFQRLTADSDGLDGRVSQHFQTVLPHSPLSYDGVILKIAWCVRVRAFLSGGRDIVGEQPFRLGGAPRAVEVTS